MYKPIVFYCYVYNSEKRARDLFLYDYYWSTYCVDIFTRQDSVNKTIIHTHVSRRRKEYFN